ncbi:unnamed protein product [Hydatigera taeniaeformis]|uniref:CTP_transf_like domain-containing protein n=1 Tax=Hydatigena taeniaeformis TaxID=6205 RepID=A0A158RE03_HYDTA|nr:unnamed protein product [Hydatigera taeniaeformis]
MNERRQDVRQPSRSNSNQSASSSPTSLDTVVFAASASPTATVTPTADSERRARSLPSSTSNSSAKSVSTASSSSSLNGSSTRSSSTTTTNTISSYDSSSYSSTENTTSFSSSYSSYSSSTSTSPRDPAVKSAAMSSTQGSSIRVKRPRELRSAEGAVSAPSSEGEPGGKEATVVAVAKDFLPSPPPVKVERSEGSGEWSMDPCDCRCYCSWQSVAPEPVVLVACGSFNPITTMHLRMMELARDAVEKTWSFQQQQQQQRQKHKPPQTDNDEGLTTEKGPSLSSQHLLNPRRQVVVVGILSPVSDAYAKSGLASAASRCRLARLACATTSDWLAVDSWEASRCHWTPTRRVLERIQERMHRISQGLEDVASVESVVAERTEAANSDLNDLDDPRLGEFLGSQGEDDETTKMVHKGSATNAWLAEHLRAVRDAEAAEEAEPGNRCCCGRRRPFASTSTNPVLPPVRVKLVCGADLLESFATPNLWSEEDMTALVRDYGIVCISRPGSNAARLLYEMDLLSRYEQNVILATEWSQNGLSATVVRRALARGQSVRYLVPDAALEEIYARGLYGAARPSRMRPRPPPRLVILVPPPPVTPLSPPQVKEEEEDVEALRRRPQHPSTCANREARLAGPEAPVQTLERGTDPLQVETRSHSVQTRLSSLPSPQTMSSAAETTDTAHPSGPLILHRVIVDPSAETMAEEGGGSGTGLTAILPLLKQCTRCGSQRVRLLLVERPPPTQAPSTPSPVVHTSRQPQQQRQPHLHRPQRTTLPRTSQAIRKSSDQELSHHLQQEQPHHHHHHHRRHQSSRQLRLIPTIRSLTQPVKFPSSVIEEKSHEAASSAVKHAERTRRTTFRRQQAAPCAHHSHLHHQHEFHHYHTAPPPQRSHQRQHLRTSETTSSGGKGRSLPRDVTPHRLARHIHHSHQYSHHQGLSGALSQELPSAPIATSDIVPVHHQPTLPEAFHPVISRQRPRRRDKQRVGPRELRLEGDGSATPSSVPIRGTVAYLPHPHFHRRHHLTPPAVEAQPAPPPLAPRLRRSLTTAATPAISLSQPLLTQTSAVGRPRRTYDEVDYLLYNLCLNIESAL